MAGEGQRVRERERSRLPAECRAPWGAPSHDPKTMI